MNTYADDIPHRRTRRVSPEQIVALLGPLTVAGGVLWAILQPWRLTILHPLHQGFWWLVVEPPLLVVGAGVLFTLVVARPLLADLEERRATSG
ncbi:MAG TPA: hypothetical protein VFA82_07235 [Gaiellaceae bacterium]|nr:hypothetical protein [Gaiellaceae bacterium]